MKFKNLFYVGASTTPGTGLPMVVISSKLVMERIKVGVYRKDLDALKIENLGEILIKLRPYYLSIGDKKGLRLILK